MRSLLLKAGATLMTLATAVAAAAYVSAHVKNPNAPLKPSVLGSANMATATAPFSGLLTLTPAVRSSDVQPLTSTYAS